jgi:hypothetical protein
MVFVPWWRDGFAETFLVLWGSSCYGISLRMCMKLRIEEKLTTPAHISIAALTSGGKVRTSLHSAMSVALSGIPYPELSTVRAFVCSDGILFVRTRSDVGKLFALSGGTSY